jgi:hypothetical protein
MKIDLTNKAPPVCVVPLAAVGQSPLRHRQTKEAETDMFSLQPPPHLDSTRTRIAGTHRSCRMTEVKQTSASAPVTAVVDQSGLCSLPCHTA